MKLICGVRINVLCDDFGPPEGWSRNRLTGHLASMSASRDIEQIDVAARRNSTYLLGCVIRQQVLLPAPSPDPVSGWPLKIEPKSVPKFADYNNCLMAEPAHHDDPVSGVVLNPAGEGCLDVAEPARHDDPIGGVISNPTGEDRLDVVNLNNVEKFAAFFGRSSKKMKLEKWKKLEIDKRENRITNLEMRAYTDEKASKKEIVKEIKKLAREINSISKMN